MTALTCPTCHFDAALWSDDDVIQTLTRTDRLIAAALDGAPSALRSTRAGAPLDQIGGSAVAAFGLEFGATGDVDQGAGAAADRVDDADRRIGAVHEVMHRLHELASQRRATESFDPMRGTVTALHASNGGVPKATFPSLEVTTAGIVGDAQNDRLHHGRPWQAVCLYSAELLAELSDEGHSIAHGSAGENLTVSGIDWTRLRGGLTISVGDVVMVTSMTVTPCYKIADYFVDRNWNRIHHGQHPGWARWYASVVAGGVIETGAPVIVTA